MKRIGLVLVVLLVLALAATPVYPVAKEIIQLQTAVARIESDLRDLRSSLDERMGMMRQIMEQSTATVNKLNSAIDNVQRSIQGSIIAQSAKVDAVSTDVRGLHDSLEDVRARLTKLTDQIGQLRNAVETLQSPPQPAAAPGATPGAGPGAPPAPDALYQNALRDLGGGKLDLAMQQFQDYLRAYPETDLAGNSQFYIGEILGRQGKLQESVEAYDRVLERYPRGNKTAASHLKKGIVLLEMKDREAGMRELRELIRRFPNSDEAKLARERMKLLGEAPARPAGRRR